MDEPTMLKPEPAGGPSELAPVTPVVAPVTPQVSGVRDQGPVVWVAGSWHRAVAALVDGLASIPLAALLAIGTGRIVGVERPAARHTGIDYWLDLALAGEPVVWGTLGLTTAIVALYLYMFQALVGATPGMRLLRLRVVDGYGDPPGFLRAGARTLGYVASAATLGLGFVWMAFDREKRGLHDWLAGTWVARLNPPRRALEAKTKKKGA
jgi:uncharacterized RDD family membrane protein YckC